MKNFIQEGKLKLFDYLKNHPDAFNEQSIMEYLRSSFDEELIVPNEVLSIYDELGLIPDNKNIYKGFVSFLMNNYSIQNMDILDLDGGVIPRVSKRISLLQKNGTITVYDPRLSSYETGNEHLFLVRKPMDYRIKSLPFELIISFMSGKNINKNLEFAINAGVDFCFGFDDGGPHGDSFDHYEDEDEWIHSVIVDAKNMLSEKPEMGKLKVKKQEEYGNPYPIIYNER